MPADQVVALQPYGSLFFAAAPALEACLPAPTDATQLRVTGVTDVIGTRNVHAGDERVGATLRRAYGDAERWIAEQRAGEDD